MSFPPLPAVDPSYVLDVPPDPTEDEIRVAEGVYRTLSRRLRDAYERMKSDGTAIVQVHTAAGERINVNTLGYLDPALLYIEGTDHQGKHCVVAGHYRSMQFIVRILPEQEAQIQKAPIGFRFIEPGDSV